MTMRLRTSKKGRAGRAHAAAPAAPEMVPEGAGAHERLFRRFQSLLAEGRSAGDLIGRFDHVTRLPNRVQFLDDFAADESRPDRCLVLVTLADAKHFNELLRALGHAYSEDFVRAGAERLRHVLPQGTPVYHVSVLSFAFIADGAEGERPPALVARIVEAFKSSILVHEIPIDAKVGVGVTLVADRASTPSELLRATLAAAQDSRRSYDGWAWYNRRTDLAHQRAFRILTDMPDALADEGQFALHYQPRVALEGGGCVGAEALIRWAHPELGSISPGEFVPLAETTALITPLTQWVLRGAMLTARRWQEQRPGLRMSVNISPKNLEEPHFVDLLAHDADRMGVDPAAIELEFTEGTLASNPSLMMDQLAKLRARGFDLAIDDFGSGYSNMSYLGKLPARILKIDQSFIRPLDSEEKNRLLVRSIIDLAHALGFSVVAEGIETRGSYDLLASWGCEEGQGYLMSKPLPLGDFNDWLAAHTR